MSQNINLYDASLRLRRDYLGFQVSLAAVALAALCIGAGIGLARWSLSNVTELAASSSRDLEAQQNAVKTLAERAAMNKPDAALQNEIAKTQRLLAQRQASMKSIEAGAGSRDALFGKHLQALARQSIEGLWLTGVVLRQDDVLLRGRALNPALIPAYVQRLEHEPSLQGRSFKSLEVSRPFENEVKPAAQAAATPGSSATVVAAAPQLAEFVEFKLSGASQDPATMSGAKP